MLLQNLADPRWLPVHCYTGLLRNIICIKDKITQESVHINNSTLKRIYFCESDAILVNGKCYHFLCTHRNTLITCMRENIKVDIMIFKHVFEAIALEDMHLSAFTTMSSVTFIQYLDKVTFDIRDVSHPGAEGYIICPSKRTKIHLGTHMFNCSGGGNILNLFICAGTVDCPNDRSDEELCTCNESKYSKLCKIINHSKYFNICSPTYYMAINGKCLRYLNPNKIYQHFHINMDASRYRTSKTSKMATFDLSLLAGQQKVNNTIKFGSDSKFIRCFRCLNKGEVPC